MLSKLVLDAVEGQVKKVIFIGSIIVGFTAVIKSIMIIVQIKSEKYIFNTERNYSEPPLFKDEIRVT